MQETLDDTDSGVFQELLAFAQASHAVSQRQAAAIAAAGLCAGHQLLPTALVLAGGVNSADHCTTFPALAAHLRGHGCYVALLQPASFGKVSGDAIGEALRQVSGLTQSRAEHLAGLVQWYQDETGGLAAAAEQLGEQQQQQQVEEGASESESGDEEEQAALDQDAGRRLRRRPHAGGAAAAASAAAATAQQQAANRQRPLVVIVENTEGVDVQCLRDFVVAASEVSAR